MRVMLKLLNGRVVGGQWLDDGFLLDDGNFVTYEHVKAVYGGSQLDEGDVEGFRVMMSVIDGVIGERRRGRGNDRGRRHGSKR